MFRRIVLTAAAGIAVLTGMSVTPSTAAAQPPGMIRSNRFDFDNRFDPRFDRRFDDRFGGPGDRFRPIRGCYQVLVRHRFHWDVYATYNDRYSAEMMARRLHFRGMDVRIEHAH